MPMSMFPSDFQKYEPFKVRAIIEKNDSAHALFTDDVNKLSVLSHTKNLGHLNSIKTGACKSL
jgi:hypothetical protein